VAAPVSFSATAIDFEDGDLTSTLVWSSSLDGALGSGGSFVRSDLTIGTHTVTAFAADSAGLPGAALITLTIAPNQIPVVTIVDPPGFVEIISGETLQLTVSAIDPDDGNLSSVAIWSSNLDGVIATGASVSVNSLSVGLHAITCTVTDSHGANGFDQTIVSALVNTAPTVAITSPIDGSTVDQGVSVDLVATATDLEHGDLTAGVAWTSDVDGALGTGGLVSVTTLSVGTHLLTATSTDPLSVTGTDQVSLTVPEPGLIQAILAGILMLGGFSRRKQARRRIV
jgi:hypothetical protein